MKQFNDITIIGIDQGYGNMKTANTIFPTAITAYDTAPMFKGDVLEYGGKFYRVGEGHKGFVADKSTDGDFYLLTLAAIAKELEQYRLFTASLCLSVGLPLSWVGSQRESFRQYLIGVADAHTGRPRTGVETLLEAAESGEIRATKPAVCAMEQPGAITGLAGSVGRCREPHTGRKTAIRPCNPSKPCGAGAG